MRQGHNHNHRQYPRQTKPTRPIKTNRAPRRIFLFAICVSIIVLGVFIVNAFRQGQAAYDNYSNSGYTASPSPRHPLNAGGYSQYNSDNSQYNGHSPQTLSFNELADISNDLLLLVNPDYAVPPHISGNLVRISGYVRALNPAAILRDDALTHLRAMFDSAENYGFTQFRVTQAFRTHEYQQNLFEVMGEGGLAAPPGHSEHQVGLAVDISYEGVNIGNSVQGDWLMANSYRYGFILRYPEHKTEITGVPFEPWHYRYVGLPHAYYMTAYDLVLEEYIQLLQQESELTVRLNGVTYTVRHVSADETIVIPEMYSFTASLDNTGGIIVTMWPN